MENWYQRSGVIAVTKSDNVFFKPLEMVYGRNLEEFRDAR
jgi:hypothetical protein